MNSKLADVFQSVDEAPTMASYQIAARELGGLEPDLQAVRIALLSTFTIDSLIPYLKVEAARHGFAADLYVGPFNSVNQELIDPTSGCTTHDPDIVFVAQLLADVCPIVANDFLISDARQIEHAIDETVSRCLGALSAFRETSRASFVVHNFALPRYPLLGIGEASAEFSQTEAVRRLNARLGNALKQFPGVYLLDFDRLCADVGHRNWHDERMWQLARAPLSSRALPALARSYAAFLVAIAGKPRKCLVLDLDNTLWGGVVGESGVEGIKLGATYPGSAYQQFQQVLLQLHQRGILLAINSKNNPADVEEVFRRHPDMVLKPEHFASVHINWLEKPKNMLEIAKDLNLGLESLVFFDDSPIERAMMRQALPEVLTLQVPKDVIDYPRVLLDSGAFERLSFTEDDRQRGQMYREQLVRRERAQSATSLEEFLADLQMTAAVHPVDQFAFPRVWI